MKYLDKIKDFFTVKPESEDRKEALRLKYQVYRELLGHNNDFLSVVADMEEKLSGDYIFDRRYIVDGVESITNHIKELVTKINELTGGSYPGLYSTMSNIAGEIEKLLTRKKMVPSGEFTTTYDKLSKDMVNLAGGKNANLGEIKSRLGLPIPEGFAITSASYARFMAHNGFLEKINEKLADLSIEHMDEITKTGREIQEMVINAEIPKDMEDCITHTFKEVFGQRDVNLSVRSSAIEEDDEFSFAGAYATFLSVKPSMILEKYKSVIASLFSSRAIFYYKTKGFKETDIAMAVGVLEMVNAKAGGVMYSLDPNDPQSSTIIINAIRGLGKCVVDGCVEPEAYTIKRTEPLQITDKRIPEQYTMVVCSLDGTIEESPMPDELIGSATLSDDEVLTLARYAVALEDHYGTPQDVEWALDQNGKLVILQTRPLAGISYDMEDSVPPTINGRNLIISNGVIACRGVGHGKAFLLRTDDDLKNFPEGAVLVARNTSPKYVTIMNKASAIITDVGGSTGHMASLAREYHVPSVLDTGNATELIKPGQEVTVDAVNCNIYDGYVEELIKYGEKKRNPLKETVVFKTLEHVLKHVVPLNLTDPEAVEFTAENCKTYHDITRFIHEKAMNEMFKITDVDRLGSGTGAVRMNTGLPVEILVIDLGGGYEGTPNIVQPEQIRSEPFNSFFKGMGTMRWPQGAPLDVKGFIGLVAHSASIPENHYEIMAQCSFVFISEHYMNFSVRLGYHLSTVEAFSSDHLNDNYIRFHFKGGGAHIDRRLRRVRLISEILKALHFDSVSVRDDVIDASLSKYKRSFIMRKLLLLGKLTAYTKQLDMVMYNDSVTDMYIKSFIKDHIAE
ncbi:MAG: PEP-utilizing enzyme [Nitrospirae bacterium YQR-1]